jgi:hypothetical protein
MHCALHAWARMPSLPQDDLKECMIFPSIILLKIGCFCRLAGYPLMHISVQWVKCWVWRLFSVHAWYRHDGGRPKPFDHVVSTVRLNAIYMYAAVAHVHLSTERRVLPVAIDMWSHLRPVSTELASATVLGKCNLFQHNVNQSYNYRTLG